MSDARLRLSVTLEVLLVALSLYAMLVAPNLMAFAAGFVGFNAAVIRRSLRRARERKRITATSSEVERALDLADGTRDWKFDVVEFGFIALVTSSALPTALRALSHDLPGLAGVLGVGLALSVPGLLLSGREAVSRIVAQTKSKRLLQSHDWDPRTETDA